MILGIISIYTTIIEIFYMFEPLKLKYKLYVKKYQYQISKYKHSVLKIVILIISLGINYIFLKNEKIK